MNEMDPTTRYSAYGYRQDQFSYLPPYAQADIINHAHTMANMMNYARDLAATDSKIKTLREEAKTADAERVEEIVYELARHGKTLIEPGSPEAEAYANQLSAALADHAQINKMRFPHVQ